jgi:hypothetical protein
MNGKQVTMIARPGARLSSVISRKSWTVRRLNDWPSPRSIEIFWRSPGALAEPAAPRRGAGAAAASYAG